VRMLAMSLIVFALSLLVPDVSRADVADMIRAARAKGDRCDFPGALTGLKQALAAAPGEWKPGNSGFMIIHQDLATYEIGDLDYFQAEKNAREALALSMKRTPQNELEKAAISLNLAVALAGLGKRVEAAEILARVTPLLIVRGDRQTAANAELIYSDFEFKIGHPESGQSLINRAAERARQANIKPSLRVTILQRLADARRRALDFDGATSAVAEAAAAQQAITGKADSPRLSLIRAAISFERGALAQSLRETEAVERANPSFDPCDPTLMVDVIRQRANIHMIRRDLPEAAAALTQAQDKLSGLHIGHDARAGEIVFDLAVIASMSRDFDRSSALFKTAIVAFKRAYGDASEAEAQTLLEEAVMLGEAGRAKEGVESAKAALAILGRLADQSPLTVAYGRTALGIVSSKAGDQATAQKELTAALETFEHARGATSFDLTPCLHALGEIALDRGDAKRAEVYFRRALAIQRQWGGDSAVSLGVTLSNVAAARSALGDHNDALDYSAEAVDVLRKRIAIGEARPWNDADTERMAARSILTRDLSLTAGGATPGTIIAGAGLAERMLSTGQLANAASTGSAIAQMATRLQTVDPTLSALLNERNDLSAEWREVQQNLVGSLAKPVLGDDVLRKALLSRQDEIAKRLDFIDGHLSALDPKLDLLIKSKSVSLTELQNSLRPKEAVLSITLADQDAYVVLVTRDAITAHRSTLGRADVDGAVQRLRYTFDREHWPPDIHTNQPGWTKKLPQFDNASAHGLFAALIAPVMSFLSGTDTLLVVPDGALGSIPFAMLLTEPVPKTKGRADDYRQMPWLVRRFAVVNYPSVASIVTLRSLKRSIATPNAMFGVGDPRFAAHQSASTRDAGVLRGPSDTRLTDVRQLGRMFANLPETRAELVGLANAFGIKNARLLLGPDATERSVRAMPLEQFGVIVFATHALVAGELSGYAEPALVLTPPAVASKMDNGLLSASEIASMRMRANWVILSACNTAAGDGSARAEPLSGLAKSFFYAGARSLLASHWPVFSPAAAKLTVSTVRHATSGQAASKALRAAELEFIEDHDGDSWSHPLFWAPFSLIGD
jgi:CHAT domain-containing protein/tetratricopeptide (TPR) repeat protein